RAPRSARAPTPRTHRRPRPRSTRRTPPRPDAPRPRPRRADRRVLELPGEPHLRGDPDQPSGGCWARATRRSARWLDVWSHGRSPHSAERSRNDAAKRRRRSGVAVLRGRTEPPELPRGEPDPTPEDPAEIADAAEPHGRRA